MRCLDVGCGPGAVMRSMADRVGPEGQVTGIDFDGTLGRQALEELRSKGGAQFAFVEGDVLQLADLPGAPFDVAFCRLLLMHMTDPVAVLAKMRSWVRPGGYVVAQELDFGSFSVEPEPPVFERFNRVFHGVFNAHGRDMRAGRHLPCQFEAAGIGLPDATRANSGFVPLAAMAPMLAAVYKGMLPAAEALGLAKAADGDALETELTETARDSRFFCLTPTLVSAWKQLP
jgi:SAM-dependent methyltransferase